MSKPQMSIILISIALQYARRAPVQNVSTRRNGPRPETRPTGPRPRHIAPRRDRDRDVSTSRDRDVSTETTSLYYRQPYVYKN